MPGFLFVGKLGRFSPRRPPRGAAPNRASPKLQHAAKAFVLRLVAENGLEEAARVLRDLADEVRGLEREESGYGRHRKM